MRALVREFAEHIVRAFPEWANALESPGVGEDADNCSFCVVPPMHPTHRLYVLTRGNSVEVRYDDAGPPGPAEKVFIGLDEHPAEVGTAVAGFVQNLICGRIVVVRERLGRLVRWLRRDCDSVASFRSVAELGAPRPRKIIAVYSWREER